MTPSSGEITIDSGRTITTDPGPPRAPTIAAGKKFDSPMNSATKRDRGRL
jgi:hypothetical protein